MLLGMLSLVVLRVTPDECREAYAALHYRDAARVCVEVLASAPEGELVGLYKLAALSVAAVGEFERATTLFTSLLMLDPTFRLDESISPRLRAPFDRAKALRGDSPATLTTSAESPLQEGTPVKLRVAVDDGDVHPIVTVEVAADLQRLKLARAAPATHFELSAPRSPTLHVTTRGFDAFGAPVVSTLTTFEVQPKSSPRSAALSWHTWALADGALLLGSVAVGVVSNLSLNAANRAFYADERARDLLLAHDTAIAADVGFAVVGAVGVVSLALLIVQLAGH